jgi:hypothetical protein
LRGLDSVVYRTDTLTGMVKPRSGLIASLAVGQPHRRSGIAVAVTDLVFSAIPD